MADTLRSTDVPGLARLLPRGDISTVAAPYGAGDAQVADILVAEGDRMEKGTLVAKLDDLDVLESAVLIAKAGLAVRKATLVATRSTVQGSHSEARALLDQARSVARELTAQRLRSQGRFDRSVTTLTAQDAARGRAAGPGRRGQGRGDAGALYRHRGSGTAGCACGGAQCRCRAGRS